WLPGSSHWAATWSVALMELGALVCTAARPECDRCPAAARCSWRQGGRPAALSPRKAQRYEGSDRQCRGALLAVLRAAGGPVPAAGLGADWPDRAQRDRVLVALLADGLAQSYTRDRIGLPGDHPA
ncbi:MAG: A/G-specific adenine glycosylase, partial [Streptosporangiaceae bacterium]